MQGCHLLTHSLLHSSRSTLCSIPSIGQSLEINDDLKLTSCCSLNTYRRLEQILTIVGAMTLALLVCISRVWLGYHTLEQVLVGVAVGSVCGSLWFLVTHKVRSLRSKLDYQLKGQQPRSLLISFHGLFPRDSDNSCICVIFPTFQTSLCINMVGISLFLQIPLVNSRNRLNVH